MSEQSNYELINNLYLAKDFNSVKKKLSQTVAQYGESRNFLFYSGVVAFDEQKFEYAIETLVKANELAQTDLPVMYNLGMSYTKLEQYANAMTWFKKILTIKPDHVPTLLMVSATFDVTGNPSSSERTCKMILSIDPDNVSAYNNLGNAYKNSGQPQDAVNAYLNALERNPKMDSIRSNLLFSLNYAAMDGVSLKNDHEAFAKVWDNPKYSHNISKITNRKFRIGIVSPDFNTHSVAYFLTGLYSHIDRDRFFIASYGNVQYPDMRTKWFEQQSDIWRDINDIAPEQVAEIVHDDSLDILIDLGGHTGGSNLAMFGYQPSPIQITWLGYPATTGMKTIQYRLTDNIADPIGSENQYTEKLYRLPHFLNYTPRTDTPDCNFTASENRDYILFGSFNNIAKLSPHTIELWAAVLSTVPNSKLLIKHKFFNDPGVQKLFLDRFKEMGVSEDQLIFKAFNFTNVGHFEEYHQIDIALDSYPYNGTTTTFEAMVMGVPTMSLEGDLHASRVGSTIMKGIGLPQFAASTPEEFLEKVLTISSDKEKLLTIKKDLRDRFYRSPFADQEGFTKSFENALLDIWESNCE